MGSVRSKEGKRAQISMEYLMIVGFALAMTIPLLLIFNDQSRDINNELASAQAEKAADELIIVIDSVYYLGPPSSRTIKVYFPENILDVQVYNHSFAFNVEASYGDYEIVRWTSADLDGSLRSYPGLHVITITAHPDNISISD